MIYFKDIITVGCRYNAVITVPKVVKHEDKTNFLTWHLSALSLSYSDIKSFFICIIWYRNVDIIYVLLQCEEVIESSLSVARDLAADVDLHLLMHDAYGKGFMKKCRVSPDAYLQMALQLAYYRVSTK